MPREQLLVLCHWNCVSSLSAVTWDWSVAFYMAWAHLHYLFSRFYTLKPAINIDTVEGAAKLVAVHGSPTPSLFHTRLTDGHFGYFPFERNTYSLPFLQPEERGNANISLSVLDLCFDYMQFEGKTELAYQFQSCTFLNSKSGLRFFFFGWVRGSCDLQDPRAVLLKTRNMRIKCGATNRTRRNNTNASLARITAAYLSAKENSLLLRNTVFIKTVRLCAEVTECSLHPHSLFMYIHFNIILLFTSSSSKWPSVEVSEQNVFTSSFPLTCCVCKNSWQHWNMLFFTFLRLIISVGLSVSEASVHSLGLFGPELHRRKDWNRTV